MALGGGLTVCRSCALARCRNVTFVSNVCSAAIGANLAAVSITLAEAAADAMNMGMPTSAAAMLMRTMSEDSRARQAQSGAELQHGDIARQDRDGSDARKEAAVCASQQHDLSEWSMSVSLGD